MKKSLGYSNPEASFNKVKRNDLYSDLPKVKLPLINTMIKNFWSKKNYISKKKKNYSNNKQIFNSEIRKKRNSV